MFMLKWKKTSLVRMGIFYYGILKMLCSFMHHTKVLQNPKHIFVGWFIYCIKTEIVSFPCL